jgi:hypothetical protein
MVGFVRTCRPRSILEVGSGPQGIGYFLRDVTVVGTDIRFGEAPLANVRPVVASCAVLPFRDRAFDLVVSSDMMEHLPENMRQGAMKEMLRVADRFVVVGFPSGIVAKTHDLEVVACLKRQGIKIPVWVSEHLQYEYPTSQSVLRGLALDSVRCRIVPNANWRVHKAVVLLQTSYHFNRLAKLLRLDNINLLMGLGKLLDRGRTYREIIFLDGMNAAR